MYLTFFTKAAPKQITFDELLLNPYMTLDAISSPGQRRVTVEITEEYGQRLFNKQKDNIKIIHPMNDLAMGIITEDHYKHYEIPKKNNPSKKRPIDAPDQILSTVQTNYKAYLEDTLKVLTHKAAHAYVAKRSTVTAMQMHQKNESKWFLQLDLKNFFNSINEEFLRRMLLEVYPFKFIPTENLEALIHIALLKNELPQGSHLSPLLTNLIMVPIDYMITEKLNNYRHHHFVYTRYADDITISCKQKFDWQRIKRVIERIFRSWDVPFHINEEKTRFGSSAGRNYHVGLIINKDNQISVGHEKNNKFKAKVFNFCIAGDEWELHDVHKFLGIISYYKSIEPDFVNKTLEKYNEKFNMDILAKAKQMIK